MSSCDSPWCWQKRRTSAAPSVGVVAAAALGDVVEERGDVQQPAALEAAHQLAAQRILVRELGHGEAPQVAHHHQDVLVDGVDVEQVVLHLADDAAERRQVAAEDAVLVHAPQLVHDAARLLQDVQEQQRASTGSRRNARIDAASRAPQRAQRARGHAAQLGVLHHQQEALEDRASAARSNSVLVADVAAARCAPRSAR